VIERNDQLHTCAYFLITFNVPAELTAIVWQHHATAYDLFAETALANNLIHSLA